MSDDDELANLLSEIESGGDEPSSNSDNESGAGDAAGEYNIEDTSALENSMISDDESTTYDESSPVTQAEVYDNLKRISELEDERQAIQEELKNRTNQLRAMLKHIDRGSILYKMLVSAIPGQDREPATVRAPKVPKAAGKSKKTAKKKAAAPAASAPTAKKKTAKKKAVKKQARRK